MGRVFGANTQVAPSHRPTLFGFVLANGVNLQGDEALGGHTVQEVGASDTVYPCAETVANGFYAHLVPVAVAESRLGGRILRERIEPASARLIVDTAGPGTGTGVNLELVAVHPAVLISIQTLAAELHAGVHAFGNPELEFQDEVAVGLVGAKERIGRVYHRVAHDGTVFHLIDGLAVALRPAFKVLAVEKRLPLLCRSRRGQQHDHDDCY